MHVGFRPRLKARPSLYDLIQAHSVENTAVDRPRSYSTQELLEELPPLPASPPQTFSRPRTPRIPHELQPIQESVAMAPKKAVAKDADGEDQYGLSRLSHYVGAG